MVKPKKARAEAPATPASSDWSRLTRAEVEDDESEAGRYADFPKGREERVLYCMRLMAAGDWETGKTGVAIATAHGLSNGTLKAIAAEASRRCKSVVDARMVRDHLGTSLFEGMRLALEMARGKVLQNDHGTVIVNGDPRALNSIAAIAKAHAELTGAAANGRDTAPTERPVVNIHYAPATPPQGDAPAPDPAEPAAEPGAPGAAAGK